MQLTRKQFSELKKAIDKGQERAEKKKMGTMNIVLIIVLIIAVLFTGIMIYLFATVGSIPDTLVTCVFAVLGGECGVLGWIKTAKERAQDRKWQKEDRAEEKKQMQEELRNENNI